MRDVIPYYAACANLSRSDVSYAKIKTRLAIFEYQVYKFRMFHVGPDVLPDEEMVAEMVEITQEILEETKVIPHLIGLYFSGEVYRDTSDPRRFEVATYSGRITSVLFAEPPSFNVLVDEAWLQTAFCDCPKTDPELVFDDFEQAMEEAQIRQDCDEFAGTPTVDPHTEAIPLAPNTEVTICFDRLGWYGINGILADID